MTEKTKKNTCDTPADDAASFRTPVETLEFVKDRPLEGSSNETEAVEVMTGDTMTKENEQALVTDETPDSMCSEKIEDHSKSMSEEEPRAGHGVSIGVKDESSEKNNSVASFGALCEEGRSSGTFPSEAFNPNQPPHRTVHWMRRLLLLFVLVGIAAGLLYQEVRKAIFEDPVVMREGTGKIVMVEGVEKRVIDLRIRAGDTPKSAVERLQAEGMELSLYLMRLAFRWHEKSQGAMHTGVFRFPEGVTHAGVIDILMGPPILDQAVRIPDGAPIWEVRRVFREAVELEDKTETLDDTAFARAVGLPEGMSPEGWFAPDTYRYGSGSDDLPLWRQAYRRQKEILDTVWATRPEGTILQNEYEALILASIIEKETSVDTDRALVSSVFHNRLKRGMPLQTDPTVIYGIGPEFKGNLTRADLRRATPYNTYTMNRLPPTPIAMPTKASIEAAVHPADTKYLYFVARGDGASEFSTTLAEHNRAVRRFILKQTPKKESK